MQTERSLIKTFKQIVKLKTAENLQSRKLKTEAATDMPNMTEAALT